MKLIVDIMLVVVIKIDEDNAVMEVEAFKTWCNRNGIKYHCTKYNIMYLKLMTRNYIVNIELIIWKILAMAVNQWLSIRCQCDVTLRLNIRLRDLPDCITWKIILIVFMVTDNKYLVKFNVFLFRQLFQSQLECTKSFSISNTDFWPGAL